MVSDMHDFAMLCNLTQSKFVELVRLPLTIFVTSLRERFDTKPLVTFVITSFLTDFAFKLLVEIYFSKKGIFISNEKNYVYMYILENENFKKKHNFHQIIMVTMIVVDTM